ncbi:MAG: family 20 glycosylhydrolase [Clostridia bacterium]|nr:family 20 glycosylhydrolase [Clostridia bacterium]
MIFQPQNLILTEGSYLLPKTVDATAHSSLCKAIFSELWHNFAYQSSTLTLREADGFCFAIGNAKKLTTDGFSYAINIEREGICISADSRQSLIHGMMTLLDRIHPTEIDGALRASVECAVIRERAVIPVRMAHYCIFAKTPLWELRRFLRACAALKYTHVILEFWGSLHYDCMRELAWQQAYNKEEIRPIIEEAHDLGLEVIPMFNHWGHATGDSVNGGKHVVLDQNPALQSYFSEDGWCWDIKKPKVRALLRSIRRELTELCGEGDYFHIGCDEAYNFPLTAESAVEICEIINDINREVRQEGRRTIAWGDMFLYRHEHYNKPRNYACHAPSAEIERLMLSHLDRDVIVADWQYEIEQAPVESVPVVKEAGFDCLLCSWDRGIPQMNAVISTVKDLQIMGYIHTTWNSLAQGGYAYLMLAAIGGFEPRVDRYKRSAMQTCTAALLRKLMPAQGDFQRAGWRDLQAH